MLAIGRHEEENVYANAADPHHVSFVLITSTLVSALGPPIEPAQDVSEGMLGMVPVV